MEGFCRISMELQLEQIIERDPTLCGLIVSSEDSVLKNQDLARCVLDELVYVESERGIQFDRMYGFCMYNHRVFIIELRADSVSLLKGVGEVSVGMSTWFTDKKLNGVQRVRVIQYRSGHVLQHNGVLRAELAVPFELRPGLLSIIERSLQDGRGIAR